MDPVDPWHYFRQLTERILADWRVRDVEIASETGPVPERGRVYPHLRIVVVAVGAQRLHYGRGGRVARDVLPRERSFIGLPHAWDRTVRRRYDCANMGVLFAVDGMRLVSKDFRVHRRDRPEGADYEWMLPGSADSALRPLGEAIQTIARHDAQDPTLPQLVHAVWRQVERGLHQEPTGNDDPTRRTWLRVRRWMQEHCHRPIDRNAVARALGLSPSYVSVLFREHDQHGFHDVLTMMRLQRAEALLADPTLTIATVAERSGFGHPSTFARAFQCHHGQRPSAWRRR